MVTTYDKKSKVFTRRSSAQRRRKWAVAAVVIVLLLAAGVTVSQLVAKYVIEHDRDAEMIAADFHISSNYLKEPTGTPATVPNYAASWNHETGSFNVELYNWEVENTDSVSEVDIDYKVTVAGGTLSSVSYADPNDSSQTVTLTPQSPSGAGTSESPWEYSADSAGDNLVLPKAREKGSTATPDKTTRTLAIVPTGDEVTVTVQATAPYTKKLSATFDTTGVTVKQEALGGNVTRLIVRTNQYQGDLFIVWPASMYPNPGVNEQPYGWAIGYESADPGTPSITGDRGAVQSAKKESVYYFEFNTVGVSSTAGSGVSKSEFNSDPVTYDGPGRKGATITVAPA